MFIPSVGETGAGGAGGGESGRFKVLTDMTGLMSEIQVTGCPEFSFFLGDYKKAEPFSDKGRSLCQVF